MLLAVAIAFARTHDARAGGFAQGPKLIGSGAVVGTPASVSQGFSVALSADGNTALVGGPDDDSGKGAAWVFVRSGGVWTQQGQRLVGTGASGSIGASRGAGVALSADGNTALVGAPGDGNGFGAAWVFTRSNGIWTQQGSKLVGTGVEGTTPEQGRSVALSADGNTAILGAEFEQSGQQVTGAAWVFTRSNGIWTQQGNRLVGTGAAGNSQQGHSVALSADGNTALVGGWHDDVTTGAAWVFTRSNGAWSQQGGKLLGAGASGGSDVGYSVALSPDGNTAILGGPGDSSGAGAVWFFTRSGGTWTSQGDKLGGSFESGAAALGYSVCLSSDGDTAVAGGPYDDAYLGAVWTFARTNGSWAQQGLKVVAPGYIRGQTVTLIRQGAAVTLSRDGSTLIVGGPDDDSGTGAAWIYERLCLHGDVNGSGALDVSDVLYLINFLFAGGPAPTCS